MADYSKFNQEYIRQILGLYGVNEVKNIIPQSYGISNSNYCIELNSDSKLLLKVSNDKNLEQMQQELLILQTINSKGFDYSLTPLVTLAGHNHFTYDGNFGVLFPFVNANVKPISKNTIAQIARVLAKFHCLDFSEADQQRVRSHTEVGFNFKMIQEFVENSLCPQDFKEAFKLIFNEERINRLNLEHPQTLIHADLYYDNCLFSDDLILKKMIDFEQAGLGERILDIAISISGSCLENNELSSDLIQLYIKEYESINKLTKNELNHLVDFIHVGLFSIALWRIKRFFTGNLDSNKKLSYQELLTRSVNFEHTS